MQREEVQEGVGSRSLYDTRSQETASEGMRKNSQDGREHPRQIAESRINRRGYVEKRRLGDEDVFCRGRMGPHLSRRVDP